MATLLTPFQTGTRSRAIHGTAGLDERDVTVERRGSRPAAESIEAQRERAQREFKQIWNICALRH
ncbi:hypothetical protein [Methylobacterium tarhaniae]|uniref:hypothetical protein n=1 Tax=Methylobacterium tarhaniae TaxID=1187852 RepID=UPI003CFCB930